MPLPQRRSQCPKRSCTKETTSGDMATSGDPPGSGFFLNGYSGYILLLLVSRTVNFQDRAVLGRLVPRTRSSHHNCRGSDCEFRVQSGTRIIELLVPRTRSSHHNCCESGCELRVQSGTRIIELLVPFDSEVRKRACRRMMRTSESGH